jgi:predicted 2-oxoglutarate/Fe(II)-dependent dioxygenase YbiX
MHKLAMLRHLGLFLSEGFLDEALRTQLLDFARSGAASAAPVNLNGANVVDVRARRAYVLRIPDALLPRVEGKLSNLIPRLSETFAVQLSGYQPPQLIRYQTGDFHRPHTDNDLVGDETSGLSARKVSCVIFLNAQSPTGGQDGFRGGELAFFRLDERPDWDNGKTLLKPESGLLVAFPSGIYHEVLPVREADRYTLVTWFI